METITAEQLERDLALRDLTDPADGPHAMQRLVEEMSEALGRQWQAAVRLWRGPRVVSTADNYDRLGFAPEDVTRDARYTRYVDAGSMLRSHSTALVPSALRELARQAGEWCAEDDVLLVVPGVVYRRDSIDRIHTGTPHQLDLWRLTRSPRPMADHDMDEMIEVLLAAVLPGARSRIEARVHPYTLGGRQVDVLAGEEWVEVWECGVAHPAVLRAAGLDRRWSGLALGLGLDRMLMLVKGIPDIRLLRSSDPRIAGQMLDLAPYRPVSAMPAITRDISIAVRSSDTAEELGDRLRLALGDRADAVEEVRVLSETGYEDLPEGARIRLGARPGQKNMLVSVTLRPVDRTLTDAEANQLRDLVYEALHQGDRHLWAAR